MRTPFHVVTSVLALGLIGGSCAAEIDVSNGCQQDAECLVSERCDRAVGVCVARSLGTPGEGEEPVDGCEATARITNSGAPESAFPVRVPFPQLEGLRADSANLAVTTTSGAPLPFALDNAAGANRAVFVRLALPTGSTDIVLSSCDDTVGRANPRATFDYIALFDAAELAKWRVQCEVIDSPGETCTAGVSATAPETTLVAQAEASCAVEPFSGARTLAFRDLPVPDGKYQLDFDLALDATFFTFCAGQGATVSQVLLTTSAGVQELRNIRTVFTAQCGVQTQAPAPSSFTINVAGTTTLSLHSDAGDCTRLTTSLGNVRLRRVPTTTPVVEVSTD
jgi:hypothetical protein